ncbi:N-acetylmuramoyl-L-alanine amidase OS=Lysinibacillus sphaericus OX=1421 GN=LS41612_07450 PE=4 SV=1 [Lysinibacillus sphaericus]
MTTKLIHKTIIFVLLLAFMIPHISDKELALADTSDLKVTGTILHLREESGSLTPLLPH